MNVKTTEISSGASGDFFAKVCTRENFPLYGIRIIIVS